MTIAPPKLAMNASFPAKAADTSCSDWTAWMPSRKDPAVVLQVRMARRHRAVVVSKVVPTSLEHADNVYLKNASCHWICSMCSCHAPLKLLTRSTHTHEHPPGFLKPITIFPNTFRASSTLVFRPFSVISLPFFAYQGRAVGSKASSAPGRAPAFCRALSRTRSLVSPRIHHSVREGSTLQMSRCTTSVLAARGNSFFRCC